MDTARNAFQADNTLDRDCGSRRSPPANAVVAELIHVLLRHPGGLRRWSVMRAIRSAREQKSRDLPVKLEDEVERAFRRFCVDQIDGKATGCPGDEALFYRPREKAGEVWAVHPERGKAWLEGDLFAHGRRANA